MFIDAPVAEDDDEPMAEDAGPMPYETETVDIITPQVYIALATSDARKEGIHYFFHFVSI